MELHDCSAARWLIVDQVVRDQPLKADRETNGNSGLLYMGGERLDASTSVNLVEDALKGTRTVKLARDPGLKVGEIVYIDEVTWDNGIEVTYSTQNDAAREVYWGPNFLGQAPYSRGWFSRRNRSLTQMVEITAVNGTTVTFATPLHYTFKTQHQAQLTRFGGDLQQWSGVEDLYIYGGSGGDYHGNIALSSAAYCWVKNTEAHWSVGTNVGFYSTYRCELRDSYVHETPDPNPGGAGYMTGINFGASDNLIENNIIWYGNKVVVVRASGGGNVFAYNYTDDGFGSGYPTLGESGINAGHFGTPHMELLEGNYSWNYTGDSYWGSSIYITAFRNHLSCKRAAHRPLDTYTFTSPNPDRTVYPYYDGEGRTCARFGAYSWWHNMVGNVLGVDGQGLLSLSSPSYKSTEVGWLYEQVGDIQENKVAVWRLGSPGDTDRTDGAWDPKVAATMQRDGNWDWFTRSQRWHGIGGNVGAGTPKALPDSLYLPGKPAFFGDYRWPWVEPTTGAVYTLPAKARFEAIPLANFPTKVTF